MSGTPLYKCPHCDNYWCTHEPTYPYCPWCQCLVDVEPLGAVEDLLDRELEAQREERLVRTLAIAALHEIWQAAEAIVLNDDDAQARHQRILDLASEALTELGVLRRVEA